MQVNSVLTEFEVCAQTNEEDYKWGLSISWYIDFRVFLSVKCINLKKIVLAFFHLIAISEICYF